MNNRESFGSSRASDSGSMSDTNYSTTLAAASSSTTAAAAAVSVVTEMGEWKGTNYCGKKVGVLFKRGTAYRHIWKPRWFEIDQTDKLVYYSYKDETKQRSSSQRGAFQFTRHSKVEKISSNCSSSSINSNRILAGNGSPLLASLSGESVGIPKENSAQPKKNSFSSGNPNYTHVFTLSNVVIPSGSTIDTVVLAADTESSMNDWVEIIESIIRNAIYNHIVISYRLNDYVAEIPASPVFPVDMVFDISGYVSPSAPSTPVSPTTVGTHHSSPHGNSSSINSSTGNHIQMHGPVWSPSTMTTPPAPSFSTSAVLSLKSTAMANDRLTISNKQSNGGFDLRSVSAIGRTRPVLLVGPSGSACSSQLLLDHLCVTEAAEDGQSADAARYTVFMVNLDFQRKHNNARECFVQWMTVNAIISTDRYFIFHDTVFEYMPPTPTWQSGPNRVVLMVMRQPGPISAEAVLRMQQTEVDRIGDLQTVQTLQRQYQLGTLCALSGFRAQWDMSVDTVLEELQITLHEAHQSPRQENMLTGSTVEMSEDTFREVLSSLKTAYKNKAQEVETLYGQVQALTQQLDMEQQAAQATSKRHQARLAELMKELEDELALNHQLITQGIEKDNEMAALKVELNRLESFEHETIGELQSFIDEFSADQSIHNAVVTRRATFGGVGISDRVRTNSSDSGDADLQMVEQLSEDISDLRHLQMERLENAEKEIEQLAIANTGLKIELSLKAGHIEELKSALAAIERPSADTEASVVSSKQEISDVSNALYAMMAMVQAKLPVSKETRRVNGHSDVSQLPLLLKEWTNAIEQLLGMVGEREVMSSPPRQTSNDAEHPGSPPLSSVLSGARVAAATIAQLEHKVSHYHWRVATLSADNLILKGTQEKAYVAEIEDLKDQLQSMMLKYEDEKLENERLRRTIEVMASDDPAIAVNEVVGVDEYGAIGASIPIELQVPSFEN